MVCYLELYELYALCYSVTPGLLWWRNLGTDPVDQSAPVSGVVGNVGFETCGRLKGGIARRLLHGAPYGCQSIPQPVMWAIHKGALSARYAPASEADGCIRSIDPTSTSAWRIGPVQLQTRLPCGRGPRRVCGWLAYLAATIRVGTQPCGLEVPRRRSASCVG